MAEKAVVTGIKHVMFQQKGVFEFTVSAELTRMGDSAHVPIDVMVSSSVFTPALLTTWKAGVRDAIVSAAKAQLGIDVDEVMFQDFTVLGLI